MEGNDRLAEAFSSIDICIKEIWQRLLNVPHVSGTDNFLLLGGESLLGTQAAAEIESLFGVTVSLRSILIGTVNEVVEEVVTGMKPVNHGAPIRPTSQNDDVEV